MLTSQAREIFARHRVGDRRRDPRRRADQARRAPRAHARAARRAGRARRAAHRPVRDAEPARGGRPLHGRPAAHVHGRRHRRAQAARPQDPRAGRVDGRARAGHDAPDLDPFAGGEATRKSIWPAIYPEILELVREHRSTIVFVNNRRGAERLALRLNELAEDGDRPRAPRLARARGAARRRGAAQGRRAAVPGRDLVARARHRHGRGRPRAAGRVAEVGHRAACSASAAPATTSATSRKGRIFPKFRADLLECAVVAKRMREGLIETTVVPRNPLDVLAQQIVAMAALGRGRPSVDDLHALVTRTYSYAELSRAQLENVLDMLDGRYPSRGVRRAAPAHRVGPRGGHDPRPQGLARAGDHQRRHDPRPRPVLRQPARRPPRRRARRGDGLRGAAGPDVPARRVDVADRGDHARPRRSSRPRRACPGAVPFWKGDCVGRPQRARRGDRRVRALGGRAGRRDARARLRPRRAGRPQPPRLPARAAGGDARRPERPHDRRRALPRRDRRLAPVRPVAVRRAACTPPGGSR